MAVYCPIAASALLSRPVFSFSSFNNYGLVLWGWGLRTNNELIALSHPLKVGLNNTKIFQPLEVRKFIPIISKFCVLCIV